jgi:hypothetical protein
MKNLLVEDKQKNYYGPSKGMEGFGLDSILNETKVENFYGIPVKFNVLLLILQKRKVMVIQKFSKKF